jgi:hypothetical protein
MGADGIRLWMDQFFYFTLPKYVISDVLASSLPPAAANPYHRRASLRFLGTPQPSKYSLPIFCWVAACPALPPHGTSGAHRHNPARLLDRPFRKAGRYNDGRRGAVLRSTKSFENTVELRDAADGSLIAEVRDPGERIAAFVFNPAGDRVATGAGNGRVQIWDAANGRALAELRGGNGSMWRLAFAPDGGQLAAASLDGAVWRWPIQAAQLDAAALIAWRQIVACACGLRPSARKPFCPRRPKWCAASPRPNPATGSRRTPSKRCCN